jgi:hypothetical protein
MFLDIFLNDQGMTRSFGSFQDPNCRTHHCMLRIHAPFCMPCVSGEGIVSRLHDARCGLSAVRSAKVTLRNSRWSRSTVVRTADLVRTESHVVFYP